MAKCQLRKLLVSENLFRSWYISPVAGKTSLVNLYLDLKEDKQFIT